MKEKLIKIFGIFILVIFITLFCYSLKTYIKWKINENNYNKEYVYSDNEILFYEKNNKKIYLNKIYNKENEEIEIKVPCEETVLMYCSKDDSSYCIYLDNDDFSDQVILNTVVAFFMILIFIEAGIFILSKNSSLYLGFVLFFILGFYAVSKEVIYGINYFNIKSQGNEVTAVIYSEIYNTSSNEDYKPVSYYYVDGVRYVYVNDLYISGTLEENKGKKITLYYDSKDPSKAIDKIGFINLLVFVIGMGLVILFFPMVFMKKRMEERLKKRLKI